MAGGNPEEDPMQVEKVLDDTENDSDTAAGEGDAAEGVAAGKGSGRKLLENVGNSWKMKMGGNSWKM